MDFFQQHLIAPISAFLWNYVLLYLLIGAGLYFIAFENARRAGREPVFVATDNPDLPGRLDTEVWT